MNKIILSLAALVAFSATFHKANAQTYQPFPTQSANWQVVRCWYFFQPGWHDKYNISLDGADTLYQGQAYKKLYITQHLLHGPAYDTVYPTQFFGGLRESGKQIFMFQTWASVDTTEHLVYDFNNTDIGDTIYTTALSGSANYLLGHLVTGVDSVLIGSTYHKRLFLEDPFNPYNTEFWIEGIGSSWGLPFASFWSITDNSYDLTCFYDRHELLYGNPSPTYSYCQSPLPVITCDSVLTAVSSVFPEKIVFDLYPNPAGDFVTLTIKKASDQDLRVDIYNIAGELVRTQTLQKGQIRLDVSNLMNGIYGVVVRSVHLVGTARLVIQR